MQKILPRIRAIQIVWYDSTYAISIIQQEKKNVYINKKKNKRILPSQYGDFERSYRHQMKHFFTIWQQEPRCTPTFNLCTEKSFKRKTNQQTHLSHKFTFRHLLAHLKDISYNSNK